MSLHYEELDFRATPLGDLMLRRRRMQQFGDTDIYEVKLGEDFLMTSLFHEGEEALTQLGLGALDRENLDVVVGGLGLGYTAAAALKDPRVSSLVVVDYMEAVIEWHREGLVPLGKVLTVDARCRLVHGDFFALCRDVKKGLDPENPGRRHDAILLDIDHTPSNVLHQANTRFYTTEGLGELAQHLKPGGVFALWADGKADAAFGEHLGEVFDDMEAHTVEFENPITDGTSANAVYIARRRD